MSTDTIMEEAAPIEESLLLQDDWDAHGVEDPYLTDTDVYRDTDAADLLLEQAALLELDEFQLQELDELRLEIDDDELGLLGIGYHAALDAESYRNYFDEEE